MPNSVEKAASELMGAVKTVKATLENLHGVFKELAKEHGEVAALMLRVKMSSDLKVRRELFPKIREELLSHEKGELTVVYPVFRQHEELASFAEIHEAEAGTLERTIKQLSAMAYDDAEWGPTFATLTEMVLRHAKEEEDEFFPQANKVISKESTEQLKTEFLAKKAAVAQQVH